MPATLTTYTLVDFLNIVAERPPDGRGIGTALPYFAASECGPDGSCNEPWKTVGVSKGQWKRWRREAEGRFVYRDDDMDVKGGLVKDLQLKELRQWGQAKRESPDIITPGACLDFENIFSTNRRDRDRDVLEPDGGDLDPNMPLLLHHNPALPVGKFIRIVDRNAQMIRTWYAIHDNALGNDTAGLVEFGSYRFSHGFQPKEFVPLETGEDEEDEGWHVLKWHSMEGSLVTIPSLVDAQIEQWSRKKFSSPYFKALGKKLYDAHQKIVAAGLNKEKGGGLPLKNSIADDTASGGVQITPAKESVTIQDPGTTGSDGARTPAYSAGFEAGRAGKPKEAPKYENPTDTLAWMQGYEDGAMVRATAAEKLKFADLRWNKSAPDCFDVCEQPASSATVVYEWAAKYLDVPIKKIYSREVPVPAARMGSFLCGLRDMCADKKLDDVRNINYRTNAESPPLKKQIELNSKTKETFLIEGTAFYRGEPSVVLTFAPMWWGEIVTIYGKEAEAERVSGMIDDAWKLAVHKHNYLKGEAFSLSGEFIQKDGQTFDGIFLEEHNKKCMERLANKINEKGADMECRGVIEMGPAGTGKTLCGRALLNVCNATFIWISARDFYYGSGAFGGLSEGFEMARELAPSILFIEDVDNWVDRHTTDMLKTEMDGIRRYKGVTTILTTNFPEMLPEALIDRPGRFHDVLKFGLPGDEIRKQMLARWIPGLVETDAVNKTIADTSGMSGAHIHELAKYAATIQADEECTVAESVQKALAKIKEQRELIDQVQLSGSNYRPKRDHEAIIKGSKAMTFAEKAAKAGILVTKATKAEDDKPKEDEKPEAKAEEVKPDEKPKEEEKPKTEETVDSVPMLKDIMDGMDTMEFGDDSTDEMRDRHKMIKNMLKGCHLKMNDWRKGVRDMSDGYDMCGVIEHSMKSVGDVHMLCGKVADEMATMCRMENLPEALRAKGEEMMEHIGMIRDALGGYVKDGSAGIDDDDAQTMKEEDEEEREEKEEETDEEKANEDDEEPLESMQDAIPGDPNEQYGKDDDDQDREEKEEESDEEKSGEDGDSDEEEDTDAGKGIDADALAEKVAELNELGVEIDLVRLKDAFDSGLEGALEMVLEDAIS